MGEGITRELFDCVPEIEFETGCKYFLGNMNNYIQAMLSSLKSLKAKLPILETMYMTGDYTGLRTITQALRQMMSNIGASDIADMSYQLEVSLLNNEEKETVELLERYIYQLYRLTYHMEALFMDLDIKNIVREEQASFLKYDFTKTKESIKLSTGLLERKII